ncbi:sodium:inorganic phosphate symporter [Moniliophthora roreri MCA 2997]|uniref:Phosphate transporter n=1 Tax=Moniliophthora roreri (strain MCA 2997) TaxID=1381753 RepID=V2XA82_MONRO|nr:sodium:inorganic phosphate symporter [Moniliophthora roreri MCA 2997]
MSPYAFDLYFLQLITGCPPTHFYVETARQTTVVDYESTRVGPGVINTPRFSGLSKLDPGYRNSILSRFCRTCIFLFVRVSAELNPPPPRATDAFRMPILHQWDYLFAFGVIFAGLDAFMIGANDVANSFATSVSSKSLTLRQACLAAALFEFLGAVLVGARVADTVKSGIIPLSVFRDNAGVQLLSFVCALVSSSIWLTIATRRSWPVSTTYSIVSAIAGVGVAVGGPNAPNWGWNGGKGLATIFAGLIIAPAISAGFGSAVYLLIKFIVLKREDPTKWALMTSPFFFFLVGAVCTMSIIYKGSPSLGIDKEGPETLAAAIVGTGAVIGLLSVVFWAPFVYAKVVKKDYTVRWYHFFIGPLLWKREPPADAGTIGAHSAIPDYRIRKEAHEEPKPDNLSIETDSEKGNRHVDEPAQQPQHSKLSEEVEKADPHPIEGAWVEPKNLYIIARYKTIPFIKKVLTHGTNVDIHAMQAKEGDTVDGHADTRHRYPNDTEHLYSFMQVMSACTASFAHGANDISNAIGPFSVIYQVWSTGSSAASKSSTPIWALVFGAIMLVIGLATYGYNIMAVLGNRITLHSPSRGFSMELGAAITVILASQYGLPVSTTMCITGSTIGVALCNGDWKAVNWRAIGWIYLGWLLTIPIAGTAAGCLMGIILNAPRF